MVHKSSGVVVVCTVICPNGLSGKRRCDFSHPLSLAPYFSSRIYYLACYRRDPSKGENSPPTARTISWDLTSGDRREPEVKKSSKIADARLSTTLRLRVSQCARQCIIDSLESATMMHFVFTERTCIFSDRSRLRGNKFARRFRFRALSR